MESINKFVPFLLAMAMVVIGWTATGNRAPADPWFTRAVLENPRTVVVKFGADWCGPCRMMDQGLDQLEPRFSQNVRFLRINIDEKPELFERYGSGSGIPQIMIFRGGQVVARQRGFGGTEHLHTWLSENL